MSTAGKGFCAMVRQFFAPLMDRTVADTQLTSHLGNGLAAGLHQPHGLALKFLGVRLLHFCHDPGSPSGIVYPKLLPFHKTGGTSICGLLATYALLTQ